MREWNENENNKYLNVRKTIEGEGEREREWGTELTIESKRGKRGKRELTKTTNNWMKER